MKRHVGDLGIDGRIILDWILNYICEDVDWIQLVQGKVY
jgi:hypothetical protein